MKNIILIFVLLMNYSFSGFANTKLANKYWVSESLTTYSYDEGIYSEYEIDFISTSNDTVYKVFNLNNNKDTLIAFWVDDVLTIEKQAISTNAQREIYYRGNGLIKNGYLEITLNRFDFFQPADIVITCIDSEMLNKPTFINDKNWLVVQKHKSFPTWQYMYEYYFNGFSNIEGTIYHQLCYYNVKKEFARISSYWRESGDSLYKLSSKGKDSLIFCFNLEKGDAFETENKISWIVDSLVNEIWNGQNVKSWYLSSNNEAQWVWIEDIGDIQSITGLIVENSDSINKLFEFYINGENRFRDSQINIEPIYNYKKIRFIDFNKVWSNVSQSLLPNENLKTSYFNLDYGADRSYALLYESNDEYQENWQLNSYWKEENDKVYKLDSSNNQFELIYDFSLGNNDSVKVQNDFYLVVDSVKMIDLGGELRKHIYLSDASRTLVGQTIWIEGIGQNGSLLKSTEIGLPEASTQLLCYSENGVLVYQNPDYNTCYVYTNTAVTTLEDQAKLIEVFSSDISRLTIRMSNRQQGEFMLFDLEGRKILKQDINDTETQICLPLSGVFIYQFTSNEGEIQTEKIMVK